MAKRKGQGHKSLERAVKSALGGKRDKLRLVPALMGAYVGGQKTIQVAGRSDFVWVRLRGATSEVAQAFNDVVGEHFDLPILIKRDEFAHDRWRVHGRDIRAYADWGGASYLPPHAESHSFGDPNQTGGIDPVWIFKRQYMPLLPRPEASGTMSLHLEPDFYYFQGEYHWWPGSGTADLSGYIPTGAYSGKFVTVYIDGDSGVPQYIEGPEFDFVVSVWGGAVDFASYIPLPDPSQGIPIAAVRLYTGSTNIGWGDIYDLRSPQQPLGTTGSYISVFDESVYQGAVEGINFVGDGIEVVVSGSFAHVFVTGTGGGGVGGGTGTATYMLVGVPEPVDSITGAYWKTPGGTPYASGSINAFIDGISQVKGLAFEELHPESGTFQYFEVPPTGTLHEVKFGVVVIAAGQKGDTGDTGAEGATGAAGAAGPEGATGSQGVPGAAGTFGVFVTEEGVPIGTGTILDFVGEGVEASISGTVARIFITGAPTDIFPPVTGTVVLYDDQTILGSVEKVVVEGDPAYAAITGAFGYISFSGSVGPAGPEGATGSTGETGAEGATGSIGLTGAEGATGSQGIQGIEGATGSQGIQGIEGATGSQGIQGIEGATGSQGIQGIEGATGSQGIQGVEGATGSQGIQGIEGATGSQGIQGIEGATGSQGIQGIEGATGSQGIQGIEGATGSQGIQGVEGATGSQGIQGVEGATGSQGIQGIEGATGSQGIQGVEGATGSQGIQGVEGATGSQGIQGIEGATGSQGIQGVEGATGSQGIQGVEGATGSFGPTGPAGTGTFGIFGLDSGVPLGTGTWVDFRDNLTATISGTVITIDGLAGGAGAAGLGVMIWDEGIPQQTGTTLDFVGDGVEATVSGTVVQISIPGSGGSSATGTATYVRAGEAIPLTTQTGGYWKVPDDEYATGTLAVGINGVWQTPVTDYSEQHPASGTFEITQGLETGSIISSVWGVLVQFAGLEGPQGIEGATGSVGPAGAEGATGTTGETGAEGATGSVGPAGAEGATGSVGPAGAEGATGTTGETGAEGATGSVGPAGAEGATGSTGETGAEGATGSIGPQGIPGPFGVTVTDEGAFLGTGTRLDFTGGSVEATISGSVVNVDVTAVTDLPATGTIVLYDEDTLLGSFPEVRVKGTIMQALDSGSYGVVRQREDLLWHSVTGTRVYNTTDWTTLAEYTIPAGTMGKNSCIELFIRAYEDCDATRSAIFRVVWGTGTHTAGSDSFSSHTIPRPYDYSVTIRNMANKSVQEIAAMNHQWGNGYEWAGNMNTEDAVLLRLQMQLNKREHGILGQISTVNSPALLRGIGVVMAFPDVSMKNTEEELTLIRAIFSAISVWLETVASPTKQPLLDAINDYKTALEEEAAEVP